MELFCGEGIITSDGSAWQHSRGLLKHVFRTHNIVHLPTLELATDELFSHIPADGETVDLQPLFSNLVSASSFKSLKRNAYHF
jgi:cytochrome P450